MYIPLLRPWRFISGPRRESISGLITLIMIRGTDARTVTDIPTGKQLPEFKENEVGGRRSDVRRQRKQDSRQIAADSPATSSPRLRPGQAGS